MKITNWYLLICLIGVFIGLPIGFTGGYYNNLNVVKAGIIIFIVSLWLSIHASDEPIVTRNNKLKS